MAESEQAKVSNAGRAHVDVVAEEAAAAAKTGSAPASEPASDGLDAKTKDELLQEVERREQEQGVDLGVKSSATKDEILKALRG